MNDHGLRLRALGIDTQQEHVIYMRRDCHVCRAEGFEAQTRLEVGLGERRIIATLNVVESELLAPGQASLSTSAWRALDAAPDARITVAHAPTLDSLSAMRRVLEREGACLVWGGALRLSPADDMLIRVERPLDLDSDAQLVASVLSIDNRRLARVAKLAGAPAAPTAGLEMHVRLGERVQPGMPLFTLHAEARGELAYAQRYLSNHPVLTLSDEAGP